MSDAVGPPADLRRRLAEQSAHALRCGALRPLATEARVLPAEGIAFLVRQVSSLVAKDLARRVDGRPDPAGGDPFLPYDPDLFVADLSATHVALLNKFPALPEHALIVTRAFEPQTAPLTAADMGALWACLAQVDGLAFYNGGGPAGASQPHKHLQLVPWPAGQRPGDLPIAPLLAAAPDAGPVAGLPYPHAFARLPRGAASDPARAAAWTLARYLAALGSLGLAGGSLGEAPRPYNLLLTRQWLLVAPRTVERCGPLSINALGLAGWLLVKDDAGMAFVEAIGPAAILRAVTG